MSGLAGLTALTLLAGCGAISDAPVVASGPKTTITTSTTIAPPGTGTGSTSATTTPGPAGSTPAGRTATTGAPTAVTTPTTSRPGPAVVNATDRDDGKTFTLRRGDELRVTLGSTYWTFDPVSDTSVLTQQGAPVVYAAPIRSCGPIGSGCGSVTGTYTATGTGESTVTATQTTCGEAMNCAGNAGHLGLTVRVA